MALRPNILIITTDQQSASMMSCSGNPYLKTPSMDRIASWGTRLEHAYTSNPVCSPARFSWYTGRMPSSIGLRKNGIPLETLPEEVHRGGLGNLLKDAGYSTWFGGKQHFPSDLSATTLGFENFENDARDELAKESARHISSFPKDQPWLLAANFINPHDICYQAIRSFKKTEQEQSLVERGKVEIEELEVALSTFTEKDSCPPLPDNFEIPDDEPKAIQWLVDERPFKKSARKEWGEKEWRQHRWAYHRLTERVDEQIGIVLDALEQSGHLENTLIIFTSDHGDHSSAHRLEHKTTFYDESARVPLLIAHPGSGVGGVINRSWVSNIGLDLMATCCDYAGIEKPSWNRGMSLRPLVQGKKDSDEPNGAFVESQIGYMWASKNHKYCQYDVCGFEEVLYDRVADPGEMNNWISDDRKKDVLEEHRASLKKAMAEHGELKVV